MAQHYKAFISYRHVPADITAAKEVQKQLEHFHIPSSIRKAYGIQEIGKLFRDQDELPITSDISENITEALHNSEKLIVICSKDTASSRWVAREISEFMKTHSLQDILTVLVNGEPGEVIPQVLLEECVTSIDADGKECTEVRPREPLSCDLRKGKKEGRSMEIPRLAAALIGCSYDELVQRQKQYKTRRLTAWTTAISILTTSGAGYMTYSRSQVQNSLWEAQIRESMYLASEAKDLLDSHDNITAAQLILEALPSVDNKRPLVPQALGVLTKAVSAYKAPSADYINDGKYTMNAITASFSVNEDGTYLAIRDEENELAVYDLRTDSRVTCNCLDRVYNAVFTDEDHLMVNDYDKVQMYDLSDESVIWEYEDSAMYSSMDYVCAGDSHIILLDHTTFTVLDSHTGELLLQKEREADSMHLTASDANTCFSADDRYFRTIRMNYETDANAIVQFDTETGEMLEGETMCSDYSVLTATENGTALAGTIASMPGQMNDTLRVEIYDQNMKQTGTYEEAIGPNHSVKDIRMIPYPVREDTIQNVLAVIYDNREILLDPVTGAFIRQIIFQETIAVPFLSVTEKSQLHLNSHGQHAGFMYEDNWTVFGNRQFPENIRSARLVRMDDGRQCYFIQERDSRSIQRYTQGVYDTGMEDLGAPDETTASYIDTGETIEDSYVYISHNDSKLYVCRIHDGVHTVTSVPERISSMRRMGKWQGNILYSVYLLDQGKNDILSVTPDGQAQLLGLEGKGEYVVAADTLYEVNTDGLSRIDPETMQKENIVSGYMYFKKQDPDSDRILVSTMHGSAVVELKSGKMTEFEIPSDADIADFSDDGHVFMIQDNVYTDLIDGTSVQLPVSDSCAAYRHGDDLYLLATDGTLTVVDVHDGHTKQKTMLSGNGSNSQWQVYGDTLYIYTGYMLYMVDLSTCYEYAAVRNCISYDPVKGEVYVEYSDQSTTETRSRIGRFHFYTLPELLEKGYAYTRGERLEEPLRLRYGLK